jgi:hypothetical protein
MKWLPAFAWLGTSCDGRDSQYVRPSRLYSVGMENGLRDGFSSGPTFAPSELAAVTLRFYERNARRCAWFRRRGARPATPARARHSPSTRPNRDAARLCRFIGNTSAVWRSASVFQARRLGRLAVLGTHLKVMQKCSKTRRQRLLYCVVFDPETLPDYKQRRPF